MSELSNTRKSGIFTGGLEASSTGAVFPEEVGVRSRLLGFAAELLAVFEARSQQQSLRGQAPGHPGLGVKLNDL